VNHELGTVFSSVRRRIISTVKRDEFVNDTMNIILRGSWCHIISLKVDAQQRIKLILCRTASTRNLNVYSINSLSST
jgi:hypothetical protein